MNNFNQLLPKYYNYQKWGILLLINKFSLKLH